MRRRDFVAALSGALAMPRAARAQQTARVRRVGVLLGAYTAADQASQARIGTFLKSLRELGWEDGRNLRIVFRWGAGNTEQNTRLAAELVRSAPDVTLLRRSSIENEGPRFLKRSNIGNAGRAALTGWPRARRGLIGGNRMPHCGTARKKAGSRAGYKAEYVSIPDRFCCSAATILWIQRSSGRKMVNFAQS